MEPDFAGAGDVADIDSGSSGPRIVTQPVSFGDFFVPSVVVDNVSGLVRGGTDGPGFTLHGSLDPADSDEDHVADAGYYDDEEEEESSGDSQAHARVIPISDGSSSHTPSLPLRSVASQPVDSTPLRVVDLGETVDVSTPLTSALPLVTPDFEPEARSVVQSRRAARVPKASVSRTDEPFEYQFLYHRRVLIVILLCLPQVFRYSSQTTLFILLFGLMMSYVFNYLKRPTWSLVAFHFSLAAFLSSLYLHIWKFVFFRHLTFLELLIFVNFFFFALAVASYGTLQSTAFGELLGEDAHIFYVFLERWLFATLPICAMPMILHTIIELQGSLNIGFHTWYVGMGFVIFFADRLPSSYPDVKEVISSKVVRLSMMGLSSVVPWVLSVLRQVPPYDDINLFDLDFLYLIGIGLVESSVYAFASRLVLRYIPFWTGVGSILDHPIQRKPFAAFLDLFVVIVWFEIKILFKRYPNLINLPFPLNYLIFNIAALCFAVLVVLMARRARRMKLREARENSLERPSDRLAEILRVPELSTRKSAVIVALLSSLIVALIHTMLSLPLWMYVVELVAVTSFAYYLLMRKSRAAGSFFFFLFAISSAIVLWGWLRKNFGFLDLEFSLRFLPVDGITMNIKHVIILISGLYVLSVLMIMAMRVSSDAGYGLMNLVVYCQAIVLAMVEELLYEQAEGVYSELLVMVTSVVGMLVVTQSQHVDFFTKNMTLTFLSAKLVILLNNPEHIHAKIPIASLYTWCMSRVMLLLFTKKAKISNTMAWFLTVAIGVSVFASGLVIWIPLFSDVFGIQGSSSRMFGMLLLIWAVSMSPLGFSRLVREKQLPIRRLNVVLMILGFVWGLMEPVIGVPTAFSMFVPWILIVTIVLFFGLILKQFRLPKKAAFKVILFVLIAWGLGFPFASTFFPRLSIFKWTGIVLMFVFTGIVIVGTHFFKPVHPASHFYILFLLTFVITYLCLPLGERHPQLFMVEFLYDARMSLISCFLILNLFIAVTIRFLLSGSPLIVDHWGDGVPHLIVGVKEGPVSADSVLSILVNVSAVFSYLVALFLCSRSFQDPRLPYMICSSILLLLDLSPRIRYFAICCCVVLLSTVFIFMDLKDHVFRAIHLGASPLRVLFDFGHHAIAVSACFPAHMYSIVYLTCMPEEKPSRGLSIAFGVLAMGGFLLDHLYSVSVMCGWGVIESLVLLLVAVQWKKAGPFGLFGGLDGGARERSRRKRERID